MTAAMCLLTYSLGLLAFGPAMLRGITRSGAAPRLGFSLWIVATGSVIGSWSAAAVFAAVELWRSWGQLDRELAGCLAALKLLMSGSGTALQTALTAMTGLVALALLILGIRLATLLVRRHCHTRRHVEAAHLAARGAPRGPGGALVIEAEQCSVYCLAGRPGTIVITRSALAALTTAQMAAVLAHERAHLTGRHHNVLAIAGALARILAPLPLFSLAYAEIARLTEMRADDVAARQHGRSTVVDALLALALPAGPSPAPP